MLDIKGLTISYGNNKVVDDITFSVKAGDLTILMGRNGAGKSSILNAIAGLLPYQGNIRYEGNLSYLNQKINTDTNFTVFETILIGKVGSLKFKLTDDDINDVNKIMDVLEIRSFKDKKINQLSGGEVQKILIAQALVSNPQVLLLDEPTSALDLKNQYEILTTIKHLTKKLELTTLLILHQVELIERFSDKIILINDRKIYNTGNKNEIFTKKMFKDVYDLDVNIINCENELLFSYHLNK